MRKLGIAILVLSPAIASAAPVSNPTGAPPPVPKVSKPTTDPTIQKKSIIPLLEYRFSGNLSPEPSAVIKMHDTQYTPAAYGVGKDGKPNTALKTAVSTSPNNFFRRDTFTIAVTMFVPAKLVSGACVNQGTIFRSSDRSKPLSGYSGVVSIYYGMSMCGPIIELRSDDPKEAAIVKPWQLSPPHGVWSELMVSYDGPKKTVSVYVDRVLSVTSPAPAHLHEAAPGSDDEVQIGNMVKGGLIDDFKFYGDALAPSDFSNGVPQLSPPR